MAYAELILFMAILLKHFLDPSLQCKNRQFSDNHFPIFNLFFQNFALLLALFSENFAGNIGAALVDRTS